MKRILKWLGVSVLTVGGVWLLYITLAKQDFAELSLQLRAFGLLTFVGFVTISLLNFGLYVWRWKLIADHMQGAERPIHFWRLYAHRMAGFAFSYITPSAQAGGEPVRMALLVKEDVQPARAVASVTLDLAFEITFLVGFIFLGFISSLLQRVTALSSNYTSLIFVFLLFGFFLAVWFSIWRGYRPFEALEKRQTKKHAWSGTIHFLAQTEKTISDFFAQQRRITVWVLLLSALTMVFRIIEVFFIAWGFGAPALQFSQAFLAATLPGVALIVPVPAGIGVFEGGLDLIFATLQIPINPIAFVAIIRARDLLFIVLGVIHTVIATRGGVRALMKTRYDKM